MAKVNLPMNGNLFLFIKIETTGLPLINNNNINHKYYDYTNYSKYNTSRIVRLTWGTYNYNKQNKSIHNYIIKPDNFVIENSNIHKITNEQAVNQGIPITEAFKHLKKDIKNVKFVVAHSSDFLRNILYSELHRCGKTSLIDKLKEKVHICTAEETVTMVKIPINPQSNRFKTPTFVQLYKFCHQGNDFNDNNNDGISYINALMECFFMIIK
jgi:DNA polymerase III epsilon subunit-like protein